MLPVGGNDGATTIVVVVVVSGAGRLTNTDCGDPLIVVRKLPFVKPTENVDAAVRVDETGAPPAMAELVAAMVHSVGEV